MKRTALNQQQLTKPIEIDILNVLEALHTRFIALDEKLASIQKDIATIVAKKKGSRA